MAPEIAESKNTGLGNMRNKRLEERIKKDKLEKEQALNYVDPKAKIDPKAKGAPAAANKKPANEPDKPVTNSKTVKKTQQQIDEEEAEERRLVEEAKQAEIARLKQIADSFDKDGFLKQMGGTVFDFDKDN